MSDSTLTAPEFTDVDLGPALDLARRIWGFSELRPAQESAVRAALAGRDGLVVLPTGGGKSLCYQLPALLRPGLTVVVSPLISLMEDQLSALRENGVAAGMLTSTMSGAERREVYQQLDERALKLLLVAPERLMLDGFRERLERAGISALAVDEAHCISHWGHQFRPEYRMLGQWRQSFDELPTMAFTATATPRVRADMVEQLGLRDPVEVVGDFDRPNLTYRSLPRSNVVGHVKRLKAKHPHGAGIVYCLRRKDVESLTGQLKASGLDCASYHAGLPGDERRRVQQAFRSEDLNLVVATVAFGMGIDRPDVRFVVHASLPKGVEQYAQETGRAGRDGLAADCLLLYSGADFHGWKSMLDEGDPGGLDRLQRMWRFAASATCRHKGLVEHFGQRYDPGEGCGACDVCLGELRSVDDAQRVAQMILSCVVRCRGRGAAHVTDVLRGRDTQKVRQTGHAELSTYGLLGEHSQRAVRSFIDQLLAQGLVAQRPGTYPTLYLTEAGRQVLQGGEVELYLPPEAPKAKRKKGPAAEVAPQDMELFERLRALRRSMAIEREVPPYVLFNDATLRAMATARPTSREAFLLVKGVGETKADRLGPAFLGAIAAYLADHGPGDDAGASEPDPVA